MRGLPISKCARRLAHRWGVMAAFASTAIVAIIWFKNGTMPMVDELPLFLNVEKGEDVKIVTKLPISVPRVLDPLAAFVPMTVLSWMYIDNTRLAKWVDREWESSTDWLIVESASANSIGLGMVASVVILGLGLKFLPVVLLIGIVGACLWSGLSRRPLVRGLCFLPYAITTVWLLCTICAGAVFGLVTVLGAIALYGSLFLLVIGCQWVFRMLTDCDNCTASTD